MSDTTPSRDDQDLAKMLASRQRTTPNRVTWVLLALVLVLAGFAAGAFTHATWSDAGDGGAGGADGVGITDSFGGVGG